jgi:hypothetical protein
MKHLMILPFIFIWLMTFIFVTGCTQTITMVHTQGKADDVVDETSTASPTVTPTINVPITPASGLGI